MQQAAHYPVSRLLERIIRNSGDTRSQFVARLGYRNTPKALRHLDSWLTQGTGDNGFTERVMKLCPDEVETFKTALNKTTLMQIEEKRACMRSNFAPHIYIQTELKVPTSITMCALTGGIERWKKIKLPPQFSGLTRNEQLEYSIPQIRIHFQEGQGQLQFFGNIVGYTLWISPDEGLRFSTDGSFLETLSIGPVDEEVTICIS